MGWNVNGWPFGSDTDHEGQLGVCRCEAAGSSACQHTWLVMLGRAASNGNQELNRLVTSSHKSLVNTLALKQNNAT